MTDTLTATTLLAHSADSTNNVVVVFFCFFLFFFFLVFFLYYFSQKIGFDISCKLSPRRQYACNVKAYFLEKNNKTNISKCRLQSAKRQCAINAQTVFEAHK